MRAIFQEGYGRATKVLRLGEADKPVPGPDEVLVRVMAASINVTDWRVVYATPAFVRLSGLRAPRNKRDLGSDAAGFVEAVGSARTDLKVGDEVFGICSGGGLADYVCGKNFTPRPANVTFEEAAAIPVAGVTALQALHKHGKVQAGERVAIVGAGGGVGSFAVQIAKALGAHVTAVTSTGKLDQARSLGADEVIDYRQTDFTRQLAQYDLVVDIAGAYSVRALRRLLAPTGRLILTAAGRGPGGPLTRIIGARIRRALGQPVRFYVAYGPYEEQFAMLREMVESGRVRPLIDRVYPFERAGEAIDHVATEQAAGKVVVRVAGNAG